MNDLYQTITDRIVAAVEAGTPPWIKPWSVSDQRPRNAATQRPYRGINTLLLGLEAELRGYASNRWLTFRQATELKAHVRKGETGTTVVFYKLHEPPEAKPEDTATGEKRVIPLLRAFTVFNLAQIEGLPPEPERHVTWDSHAEAEVLLAKSGATIRHAGNHAYYDRARDLIQLPARSAFPDQGAFYATALHELVHWTGHEKRCNRDLRGRFGDSAYAMEELVAEMGSAFLCAHSRIDGRLQYSAYVYGWLPVLKSDKRAIFVASSKAQAAADWVLNAESERMAA